PAAGRCQQRYFSQSRQRWLLGSIASLSQEARHLQEQLSENRRRAAYSSQTQSSGQPLAQLSGLHSRRGGSAGMTRSFGRALLLETWHPFLRETLMKTVDKDHRGGIAETVAPFPGTGQGEP